MSARDQFNSILHFGMRDTVSTFLKTRHAAGVAHATAAATESAVRTAVRHAPAAGARAGVRGVGGYLKGLVVGTAAVEPDLVTAIKGGLKDIVTGQRNHVLQNSANYRNIAVGAGALAAGMGIRKRQVQTRVPNDQGTTMLTARQQLNSIIELKACDLGYTYDGMCGEVAAPAKKHYPSLSIYDRPDEIDLPLSGTAKVRFRLRSKTARQDENGKKRHSADIEIQSIDPLEEDEKPVEGGGAKPLKLSARQELETIQFESAGLFGRKAFKASRLEAGRAGATIGRSLYQQGTSRELNNYAMRHPAGGIRDITHGNAMEHQIKGIASGEAAKDALLQSIALRRQGVKTAKKHALITAGVLGGGAVATQLSARRQLDLILLGTDPRPRNRLGEFSGDEEGGPQPNAIHVAYKENPTQGMGKTLVAGAVGGVGGIAGESALKALLGKLRKAKA